MNALYLCAKCRSSGEERYVGEEHRIREKSRRTEADQMRHDEEEAQKARLLHKMENNEQHVISEAIYENNGNMFNGNMYVNPEVVQNLDQSEKPHKYDNTEIVVDSNDISPSDRKVAFEKGSNSALAESSSSERKNSLELEEKLNFEEHRKTLQTQVSIPVFDPDSPEKTKHVDDRLDPRSPVQHTAGILFPKLFYFVAPSLSSIYPTVLS